MSEWEAEFTFPDSSKKICQHGPWELIWRGGGMQDGWHEFSERATFIVGGEIVAMIELSNKLHFENWMNLGGKIVQGAHITKEFVDRMLKLEAFQ